MLRIGVDRIGVSAPPPRERPGATDVCPVDGTRGEFRMTALVCPRCHRLLGGI